MEYYIPISRRLFEHPFWCEERIYSRFEAWLDIVRSARFEDTKQLIGNRFIVVNRGQVLVSLRFLSNRWKWSTKKVNTFLDLLIQDKMITKETPKETGQTVITICNYDKYNFQPDAEETQKKRQGNTKETARKHQGNKVNKDNKLEESNIPPTPPKGEGINSKARSLFEKHFKDLFSNDYYWSAKDAGSMTKLLQKITFSREQKKMSVDDDSLLYALQSLLLSIHDDWILKNFSVAIIDSKYNEIVTQAINGNNQQNRGTDSKGSPKSAGIKSISFD